MEAPTRCTLYHLPPRIITKHVARENQSILRQGDIHICVAARVMNKVHGREVPNRSEAKQLPWKMQVHDSSGCGAGSGGGLVGGLVGGRAEMRV